MNDTPSPAIAPRMRATIADTYRQMADWHGQRDERRQAGEFLDKAAMWEAETDRETLSEMLGRIS